MKKIIAIVAATLLSFSAYAATLVPVQLLNPAGSTAGQAIVSTGPTTAPGFANIPIANVTGAAPLASPTFTGTVTIPSGASISGYAPLASPTFTGTVTVPSGTTLNQPNIVASTTGTAAASGSVGFYQTASSAAASATAGTPLNVASASLAPGVWDVQCTAQFVAAGSTVQQNAEIGVSTTSATLGAYPTLTESGGVTSAGFGQVFSSPRVPLNITTTTTVFCVAQANFTVSTMQIAGTIGAWLRH